MTRLLLLIPLLWADARSLSAQEVPASEIQRPFLWEFQQADSEVVSYLFGTIHVNDPQITRLHPQIEAAFDAAAVVWFEIDFSTDSAVQTKAITLPDGKHLKNLVSAETVARIDQRVKKLSPLLSRTALPEFQIVMWPLVLANMEAQVKHLGVLPMDMQLQAAAKHAQKKTGGLEDAASQLTPLTDLSLEQQVEFLEASLDIMDEDDRQGVSQLQRLVQLYAAGDSTELQKYLTQELQRPRVSPELKELFVETLLITRNRKMAQAIVANVQAAPNDVQFVAVGTAHLLGPGSIVEGLREAGFTVRRAAADEAAPLPDSSAE